MEPSGGRADAVASGEEDALDLSSVEVETLWHQFLAEVQQSKRLKDGAAAIAQFSDEEFLELLEEYTRTHPDIAKEQISVLKRLRAETKEGLCRFFQLEGLSDTAGSRLNNTKRMLLTTMDGVYFRDVRVHLEEACGRTVFGVLKVDEKLLESGVPLLYPDEPLTAGDYVCVIEPDSADGGFPAYEVPMQYCPVHDRMCAHNPAFMPANSIAEYVGEFILVETCDAEIVEVEKHLALVLPVIQKGFDPRDPEKPVYLPKVKGESLDLVLDYMEFHDVSGRSDKERKAYDAQFVKLSTSSLCELAAASHYLDVKPLVHLTCKALAGHFEGKTPEEIRKTFNFADDMTEEEKIAPIDHHTDHPRVRLINKLYARKRALLEEKSKGDQSTGGAKIEDDRPVEELLMFIEEDGEGEKKKKKKKKKKKSKGNEGREDDAGIGTKEGDVSTSAAISPEKGGGIPTAEANDVKGSLLGSKHELADACDAVEFDDEVDREVEEFARRLSMMQPMPPTSRPKVNINLDQLVSKKS